MKNVITFMLLSTAGCGGAASDIDYVPDTNIPDAEIADYTTEYGTRVWVDSDGLWPVEDTEYITASTLATWDAKRPQWADCARGAIARAKVRFYSQNRPAVCPGGAIGCAAKDGRIFVGGLIRAFALAHEFSHLIAWDCGGLWQDRHGFFEEIEIGY